ncbi:hypothetical protein ABWL39_19985 [Chitinivorax sp. PXF-14]|uniref:hypothetical protein n=1 Tax=Chitinivorax sp. PXF-14 TaxID=3230488 RepID=UPI00346719C7
MTIGSVQKIIVCQSSTGSTGSICGNDFTPVVQEAYVLNTESETQIEIISKPWDIQQSSALFSVVFISTVGFFLFTRAIGSILEFIKAHAK